MHHGARPLALLLLLALGAQAGLARQRAPRKDASRPAAADAEALRQEQQHAWGLVESLADRAGGVADDATRIRVEARIADLLWDRSPARARRLFRRAFDASDDLDDDPRRLFGGPGRTGVRAEIIQRVYRHDAGLAAQFSEELDDGAADPAGSGSLFESSAERAEVLVEVATGLAASDPRTAAELGRRSLADGIARGLPSLLAALASSDRAAADGLAADAIDSVDVSDPLAMRLFFVGSYAVPDQFPQGLGSPPPHGADPALAARFLRRVYEIAERLSALAVERPGSGDDGARVALGHELALGYLILSALLPAYDRYLPDVADAVRALTGRVGTGLDPDVRGAADDFLTPSADTPDEVLRSAEALGGAERERLVVTAARMAMARGADFADVKKIIARLDPDAPVRASLLAEAAGRAARRAAAGGLYEEAARIAGDVDDGLVRAAILVDVSVTATSRGETARASELLDEALRALGKAPVVLESDRARMFARLASVYAPVDPLRGFDVVQEAVKSANTASRQVASPDERARAAVFRPADLDSGLGPAFEALGRADYFRALALAQSLDDKALSILAQLAVARGAVRAAPSRTPVKPSEKHARPSPAVAPARAEPGGRPAAPPAP